MGRKKANRASSEAIAALNGKITTYEYTIDGLKKTVSEKEQVILTQKQAIDAHVIEKAELKKLHLKKVSEVTQLKAQIEILIDSLAHNGQIIIVEPCDSVGYSYPVIKLPFLFSQQDKYLNLQGGFDVAGKMNIDIKMPLECELITGWDRTRKMYKATINYDNPYLSVVDIKSFKMNKVKPRRVGIGLQAGYGFGIYDKTAKLTPYLGVGLSWNIISL
jgi:hypothetical protein